MISQATAVESITAKSHKSVVVISTNQPAGTIPPLNNVRTIPSDDAIISRGDDHSAGILMIAD
jgi:hypothetical protein